MAILAHLSRRLTRIAYRMGVEPASVRPSLRACMHASVRALTLSNMNISATSGPIVIRFNLKHHLGGGKAALCFGPDRIGNLVSMPTDSPHRVIMGENPELKYFMCINV